jgi:hypothetical protein
MVTYEEYLNAIETIKKYRDEIVLNVERVITNKDFKLLEKGTKIKLTKVHENSSSKVGDIVEVVSCFFNDFFTEEPIVVFKNAKGYKSHVSKQKRKWDYIIV